MHERKDESNCQGCLGFQSEVARLGLGDTTRDLEGHIVCNTGSSATPDGVTISFKRKWF